MMSYNNQGKFILFGLFHIIALKENPSDLMMKQTSKEISKKDRKFPGFARALSCKSNNSRINLWGCRIIKVEPASKLHEMLARIS